MPFLRNVIREARHRAVRARRRREGGYVAIVVALTLVVTMVMAAFTVDVGNWYFVAQREQKAADAAALAGVPNLPGEPATAFATAKALAKVNGFTDGVDTVSVVPALGPQPSQLKVTISKTVTNTFAGLIGVPTSKITRTATADYIGPLPMGSPCNGFGSDPEPGGNRSSNCTDTGQFWANVAAPGAAKANGDPYQSTGCTPAADKCVSSNSEYDPNGYYYVVTLSRSVSNLRFEAFDPVFVDVGNLCTNGNLLASGRYAKGSSSAYCTGDSSYDGTNTNQMKTQFTVRQPGSSTVYWDPASYTPVTGCQTTFNGYALTSTSLTAVPDIVNQFRKWVPLCTIGSAPAGQYIIQVKTNGLGTPSDNANEHNRFGLRVYSTSDSSAMDGISIAGFSRMAIYANLPSATTKFYLTRVPKAAKGQILNVNLFDIGDVSSGGSGTVRILQPNGSGVTGCTGSGVTTGNLPNCSITASTAYNGRWQTISVPIPSGYSCDDSNAQDCWWKLEYSYSGSQPNDATAWQAGLAANPVRLIR